MAYAYTTRRNMSDTRRVRLFRNGRNQAVRIPREFELPGDEATLRREGDRLILEPAAPTSLLAVLERLQPLEEDFPEIPDVPPDSVDI
jgi:antitoxin VapB